MNTAEPAQLAAAATVAAVAISATRLLLLFIANWE
jgi:hypothetical protein